MYKYLEIKEDKTGRIVRRIDLTKKNERSIERIYNSSCINLNHNEYSVKFNNSDIELDNF